MTQKYWMKCQLTYGGDKAQKINFRHFGRTKNIKKEIRDWLDDFTKRGEDPRSVGAWFPGNMSHMGFILDRQNGNWVITDTHMGPDYARAFESWDEARDAFIETLAEKDLIGLA